MSFINFKCLCTCDSWFLIDSSPHFEAETEEQTKISPYSKPNSRLQYQPIPSRNVNNPPKIFHFPQHIAKSFSFPVPPSRVQTPSFLLPRNPSTWNVKDPIVRVPLRSHPSSSSLGNLPFPHSPWKKNRGQWREFH